MIVYRCIPDFEGILSGIYDIWSEGRKAEEVRLELCDAYGEVQLFTQYLEVERSEEKALKVKNVVYRNLSAKVYELIFIASLSAEETRGDAIYRFLVQAFLKGLQILDMLQLPPVYELFRLCRGVTNESHKLREFVRFSQAAGNVLVSRICPKHDVLILLSSHFADRLPSENWMIYDEGRKKVLFHPAGKKVILMEGDWEESETASWTQLLKNPTDEEEYRHLWNIFFKAIVIEPRKNLECQRNHLPLRFRPYMTEFQD